MMHKQLKCLGFKIVMSLKIVIVVVVSSGLL